MFRQIVFIRVTQKLVWPLDWGSFYDTLVCSQKRIWCLHHHPIQELRFPMHPFNPKLIINCICIYIQIRVRGMAMEGQTMVMLLHIKSGSHYSPH